MNLRGDRVLQVWLLAVVAVQAVCIAGALFCPECDRAFSLEPRLLLRGFDEMLGVPGGFPVGSLLAGLIIAGSSWAISQGGRAALVYFVFELLYGLATLLVVVSEVLMQLMEKGKVSQSGLEMWLALGMYLFSSFIPGALALRLHVLGRRTSGGKSGRVASWRIHH
jgi:hypothetical protein